MICNKQEFLKETEPVFDELIALRSEMRESFKNIVEYFGEDVKTTTSEGFFSIFKTFIKELEVILKIYIYIYIYIT